MKNNLHFFFFAAIILENYPGRLITDINLVLADVVEPSAAGMSKQI